MASIHLVSAPHEHVVRIAGKHYAPFYSPPWRVDPDTGTVITPSANRFDDSGPFQRVPREQWFQTIYAATDPQGAYGELLAGRRRRGRVTSVVAGIEQIVSDPGFARDPSIDPQHPIRSAVTRSWRHSKQMTFARVSESARFVDISHPQTLSFLLANVISDLESIVSQRLDDFDLSDVMGRNRQLTQYLARYFHELPGEEIAGIRYLSRHSARWECWALFADRVAGKLEIGESLPIAADDADLLAVARQFGLSVETDTPGEYLRPWRDLP